MIVFKALSKAEFAEDAGIKLNKLREWIKDNETILDELGLAKRDKILPPAAVKFLAEKYQVVPRNATFL